MAVFSSAWCCFQGQPLQRLCYRAPVVLNKSAAVPTSVLSFPLLRSSAAAPTAVLLLPSVLAKSAYQPNAAFATPVVLLKRAWSPSAVLNVVDSSLDLADRLHLWQKREAEEREYDEKWWWCFELNQWIHSCYLSFSRGLTLRLRGLKEGKKTPERALSHRTQGFRSFGTVASLAKTPPVCQTNSPQTRITDSSSEMQSVSHPHNEPLSVVAMWRGFRD